MNDDFLMYSLILYVERGIVDKFKTKSIINDFQDLKEIKFSLDLWFIWNVSRELFCVFSFINILLIFDIC